MAPSKSESNNCLQHVGTPVTLYCKRCEYPMCRKCHRESHLTHPFVQITQKYQEMISSLTVLLKNCSAQKENIQHQLLDILNNKSDIETSTQMAIEEMKQQRLSVEEEVSKSYAEQIHKINQVKEKELTEFNTRVIDLRQHDQKRQDIEEYAANVLEIARTPDFITEASNFLTFNHLTGVPAKEEKIRDQMLYRHPTFRQMQDPEEQRLYVEDKILGYFATEDEEHQRRFKEPNLLVEAQAGSLKRFDSIRSVGGDSVATHISSMSGMSGLPHGISHVYLPSTITGSVEFICSTHIRTFEGSALKTFSTVFFSDNTLWICGWNRNLLGFKTTVLLNVELSGYNVLMKEKKKNTTADMPMIVVPFDDKILFTMKTGKEVFSFNPKSTTFKSMYNRPNLRVAAMCASNSHVFLLSQKETEFIHIFNSKFQREEKIATGLPGVQDCSFDMCILKSSCHPDYSIVITASSPQGSVRAVTKQGQLWLVDGSTESLDAAFSPCNVSSSLNGDIFVADQQNDKV